MVTTALKRDAWSVESDLPLVLLEITHADLAAPIRVVANPTSIIHSGNEYFPMDFNLVLPGQLDDAPPSATVSMDNVSREIAQAARSISTPASFTIRVVRAETPNVVELEFAGLKLTNVRVNALRVEGDLQFEDLVRAPYPALSFTPSFFPGLI